MLIQLIRSSTMLITFSGKLFLTDPMFGSKYSYDTIGGKSKNPTIDLPFNITESFLNKIDYILISHTHIDHFDPEAIKIIPKNKSIFCQPEDFENIKNLGFNNVKILNDSITIENNIEIIRTKGKHGSGGIENYMGPVSGFIFKNLNELTLYWIGDSILCNEVKDVLKINKPNIVISHSCGAKIPGYEDFPIIMNTSDTNNIILNYNISKVIAVHMESLDHCSITRKELRDNSILKGISENQLIIPKDGDILKFEISNNNKKFNYNFWIYLSSSLLIVIIVIISIIYFKNKNSNEFNKFEI